MTTEISRVEILVKDENLDIGCFQAYSTRRWGRGERGKFLCESREDMLECVLSECLEIH